MTIAGAENRGVLSDLEHGRQLRRAVIASTIGTTIEWYDFFIYATGTRRYAAVERSCFRDEVRGFVWPTRHSNSDNAAAKTLSNLQSIYSKNDRLADADKAFQRGAGIYRDPRIHQSRGPRATSNLNATCLPRWQIML